MQIAASRMDLAAMTRSTVTHSRHQREEAWIGRQPDAAPPRTEPDPAADLFRHLRLLAQRQRQDLAASAAAPETARAPAVAADDDGVDAKQQQILTILEKVFGVKGLHAVELRSFAAEEQGALSYQSTATGTGTPDAGWGYRSEASESLSISQQAGFAAAGTVQTADGRTMSFSLEYAMRVEMSWTRSERIALGDARLTDPLMIAMDGGAPRLGTDRMRIDLDGDGREDAPHAPAPGTWILALDADGDGRVGRRQELFGPMSGDGIAELTRLDGDGNGWIDAGDAAWTLLRVWNGRDLIMDLDRAGLGAIATAAVAMPLMATAGGADAGRIRQAGLALDQDGRALAMQQIDLRI